MITLNVSENSSIKKILLGVFFISLLSLNIINPVSANLISPVSCPKYVDSGNFGVKTVECTPTEKAAFEAYTLAIDLNKQLQDAKSRYSYLNGKCTNESGFLVNICTESDRAEILKLSQNIITLQEKLDVATETSLVAGAALEKERALTSDDSDDEVTNECMPEGVGWLLCPVINFTASLVDVAYAGIEAMLTTPSLNTKTDSSNPMYSIWSSMRSIANVIFVIAFLIIIFSQITSIGISNYGIKKLLPKIIIAAILVNISYFICAIAIDISNILGVSIRGLFDSVINQQMQGVKVEPLESITKGILSNGTSIGILTGAATVSATLSGGWLAALTLLVPGLIAAFLAIATVFIVLTLRQAIIILLVVVSPIAFVLYLLPNTESWFKKWKDLFTTMLMMFPIIAAVFGASKLASYIIIHSSTNLFIQISGVLVQFIPLAITPLVMKTAGGVLNKVGGFVNNPNRGPFDAMKKGAAGYRGRSMAQAETRDLAGGGSVRGKFNRWKNKNHAINQSASRNLGDASTRYLANTAESDSAFSNRMAGGTLSREADGNSLARVTNRAIATNASIRSNDVKEAELNFTNNGLSTANAMKIISGENVTHGGRTYSGSDEVMKMAAISRVMTAGGIGDKAAVLESAAGQSAEIRRHIVSSAMSGSTGKGFMITGANIGAIEDGTSGNLESLVRSNLESGTFNAESLSNCNTDTLNRIQNIINQSGGNISKQGGENQFEGLIKALQGTKNDRLNSTMDPANIAIREQILNRYAPQTANTSGDSGSRPVILDQYGNPLPPSGR